MAKRNEYSYSKWLREQKKRKKTEEKRLKKEARKSDEGGAVELVDDADSLLLEAEAEIREGIATPTDEETSSDEEKADDEVRETG